MKQIGAMIEGVEAGFFAHKIAQSGKPAIFICQDERRLRQVHNGLRFYAPDLSVHIFPAWNCIPYDRISINSSVTGQRMAILNTLLSMQKDATFAVLTTIKAVAQRVVCQNIVDKAGFKIISNHNLNELMLRDYFMCMGYVQTGSVIEVGEYALRGGLIDIYAPNYTFPVRLDLFGDVVETMRYFDPVTQRSLQTLQELQLSAASEVILNKATIECFRTNYRSSFGAAGVNDPIYKEVSAGQKYLGIEGWIPFFYQNMQSLFDYLPDSLIFIDDKALAILSEHWAQVIRQYEARLAILKEKQQRKQLTSVYKPIAPELLYFDNEHFNKLISKHQCYNLSFLPIPPRANSINALGRGGRNFAPERKDAHKSLFEEVKNHIKIKKTTKNVVLASFSAGTRDRLHQLLTDDDIIMTNIISSQDIKIRKNGVFQIIWPLENGFETPEICVISEQDIFGLRLMRRNRRKRRAVDFLTDSTHLSLGDLVVHIDHGVGRFQGMKMITAVGTQREFLLLEYANNDRLYVPIENMELLSRYGLTTHTLDRLGSGTWNIKKAKVKQRILDIADRLIKIAAKRAVRQADILYPIQDLWQQFCAGFPYSETEDQANAINDVIEDMASGRPMDRLICGDVGFGKTEVALRAAFIAAMNGKQVAIIAPTTLLVRQHFKSFKERFRATGLHVCQLSRLVTVSDARRIKRRLRKGSVQIIIGTHALLSRNIGFANLGLLVIDEEQKFGVTHKEKLKQLCADVHVLTMTATPIPRTLQLSLSGVRALSVIGTAPVDRYVITTYINDFDPLTVREALLREHRRGGQSFYVVPRISDLAEIKNFLCEYVPEISFVIAHGKMAAKELDRRMNAFYDGSYGILLATSIIESGLDIPRANTLIIHCADRFGLSQLYQIRGRVGRSKVRAYAYLTLQPGKVLNKNALKRLRVLASLDRLGAGFNLASQDLDIRGAGNLLGEEQSGNIREVGYALYQEMLEDAIVQIKGGNSVENVQSADAWSPQIILGASALIPANYVSDLDVRFELYRRLSSYEKRLDLEDFAAELIDRFGKLPSEVENLLQVIQIKAMCRKGGIAKLDGGTKGIVIQFHQDIFCNPKNLLNYIAKNCNTVKVKGKKIIIRRNWVNQQQIIKGAYVIARDFAALASENYVSQ